MDLLSDRWINSVTKDGVAETVSVLEIRDSNVTDITAPRPDFRGALYQFLIGLLQMAYAPQDVDEWREKFVNPPAKDELEKAFAPYKNAFFLDNDGPAFMQDFALPAEVNQLSTQDLLIDAGSSSNLYFNKPVSDFGLCRGCFAQALLTLQLNAPSGGRGIRTSLRGGGPITTLLLPAAKDTNLWQKLWLNVMPADALDYPLVKTLTDVLPWMTETRTSDDQSGRDTPPEAVHPLQAYWSMPRRIRIDTSTIVEGCCSVCNQHDGRLIKHYRTRHGGTNYTGAWLHPLTPYSLDAKGEKPPISIKGRQAGRGYRDWLGLVLGNEDHQPDAARVVAHFNTKIVKPKVRLWCFGFDMSNMKALCWYDSTLPVHAVAPTVSRSFTRSIKQILDSANDMTSVLYRQVKAAWFKRPGDAGVEPAVMQSFWQGSESIFYQILEQLSRLDFENESELAPIYHEWLLSTRQLAMSLFDHWVLSGPVEDMELQRVVKARADLAKDLNNGKAMKPLWAIVNLHKKEKV